MPNSAVIIYATSWCPFCSGARTLLARKGVGFTEIDVDADPAMRHEMIERSGRQTVPQIFIGEVHVGGFDELEDLERRGALETLLADLRES